MNIKKNAFIEDRVLHKVAWESDESNEHEEENESADLSVSETFISNMYAVFKS